MATYSSILAWRILWTEEPGGLSSWGSWGCSESDMTECVARKGACHGKTGGVL